MENDADILGLGDLPRENNIQYKVGKVSLLCIESRSGSIQHQAFAPASEYPLVAIRAGLLKNCGAFSNKASSN